MGRALLEMHVDGTFILWCSGDMLQTVLYTWDDYYWASNVLLAELTDGGTFHQQAQYFLQQWICGYNELVRSPLKTIWHAYEVFKG